MTALLILFALKIQPVFLCHFWVECWQIGDNQYTCDGGRICE